MEHTNGRVPVDSLMLDPDNPRFFHLELKGVQELDQEALAKEIESDEETITLLKAIRKSGVQDPIWVEAQADGNYLVVEGNRRTVILKRLLREGATSPAGGTFAEVDAHILPPNTSRTDLLLQKARLQAGKKQWGAFNEAAVTYQLRTEHNLEYEDIAAELQIPIKKVKDRINNFLIFKEYSDHTKDYNPKRFSYFAEAPKRVRDWFSESTSNRDTYFSLISPTHGKQKIRSASTTGGLRDFAVVLDDADALKALLTDPKCTVENAVAVAKDNNILKGMPWLRRLESLSSDIRGVDEAELNKLKAEPKVRTQLKALERACQSLLSRLGDGLGT